MSSSSKWLVGILAGLSLLLLCACAIFVVASTGAPAFFRTTEPEVLVEQQEVASVVTVEVATLVPATDLPEEVAPVATTSAAEEVVVTPVATPTLTPGPRPTDLDEVDLSVLLEAWDFIQSTFDGPLPDPNELEEVIVNCPLQTVRGELEIDPLATRQPLESYPPGVPRPDNLDDIDLSAFYDAWEEMETGYDGALPSQEDLRQLTIECSVDSLGDPFTRYISPELAEIERSDMSGSFEGIGAYVSQDEVTGEIIIDRPMEGQPAALAGIKGGDVVIGVDGEDIAGQDLLEVINKIRGPRGTVVILTIVREGEPDPFDIEITRAQITIPLVESEMIDGDIAYVRLTSFSTNADRQLEAALEELLSQNPVGLVFDLRDNPGGFLSQAVAVADLFLEESVVLYERNSLGEEQVFRAQDGDIAESIPMVLLVNLGSASASEIVAGAIRDHGRALLVGETTFGKGSVQLPHQLSDGGQINVTIARWYIPSDTTIDAIGVEPDVFVETPEEFGGEEDTQLNEAIRILRQGGTQ